MFHSDYSGYESLGTSDHSSLPSDQHLSHADVVSAQEAVGFSSLEDRNRNVSSFFSQDLSPNKRAIMEAMLTHWIQHPSTHSSSNPVLSSKAQSISSAYSSSVQSPDPSSLHSLERHAS